VNNDLTWFDTLIIKKVWSGFSVAKVSNKKVMVSYCDLGTMVHEDIKVI
jgi:hypothetical protein